MIDRGDLSRYVPIEKIPIAQESIIKQSIKLNTPTYVATNLLENMIKENEATRAESHDIYSTLKEGAEGLVLAAETAIGKNPVECVRFIKRCLMVYNKNKNSNSEIKTVGPELSSNDVFNTIQLLKTKCEKPAMQLQNCQSEDECEKAQLAMDLCFGKIVTPKTAHFTTIRLR